MVKSYLFRILIWILVAIALSYLDKIIIKKNKIIWLTILLVTFIIIFLISNVSNQIIDDILIVIVGVSTASIVLKKEKD